MHQVLQQVTLSRMPDLLRKGSQVAAQLGRPILVSLAQRLTHQPDPVRLFSAARRVGEIRNFWARPADGFWIVGAGRAGEIRVEGLDRFRRATAAHQRMMEAAVVEGPEPGEAGPLFMGGFRFDAGSPTSEMWQQFPDGLLTLPRWIVLHKDGISWVTVNAIVDGQLGVDKLTSELQTQSSWVFEAVGDPSAPSGSVATDNNDLDRWRRGVQQVLDAIEDDRVAKVTLARTMGVRSVGPLRPETVLWHLVTGYPGCRIFAICREGASFVGASPEELVSLREATVRSRCLAGSVRRGSSPGEDTGLSETLLQSAKERWEHILVVNWVSKRLGKLCKSLDWNDPPHVVKLSNVQHLSTTFGGIPKAGHQVLDFVAALHPTPAVGGVPLGAALETIRRLEGVDRGWYAGPVGWVDETGNGEFGVAIRSALLRGNEALLYAGAGIVKGSEPESEYKETAMKFKPLLSTLGIE